MTTTVYDLIGRIINPGLAPMTPAAPGAAAAPSEPLTVLIGRTLAPPAPALSPPEGALVASSTYDASAATGIPEASIPV